MSAGYVGDFPVPDLVVDKVESYVRTELHDAETYSNREPFDVSGVWSLHRLAAEIYASGFDAGCRVEAKRQNAQHRRDRDRKAQSEQAATS